MFKKEFVGVELLADFELPFSFSPKDAERFAKEFLKRSSLTVVGESVKEFKGGGITYVALLSESHFALHTYPEAKLVSVNLYKCGRDYEKTLKKTREALFVMTELLNPVRISETFVKRGIS